MNVALGKPYALTPKANYSLTTDPDDLVQLTDGEHASGGFWTDKAAVGWVNARPVSVTVDLGAVFEIDGATLSTAAGSGGVEWPSAVLLLASPDGRDFSLLGDLVALEAAPDRAPSPAPFARHVYVANGLEGQARYVRLMVDGSGPYVFADEVEIFGRRAVASAAPRSVTTDSDALFWRVHAAHRLRAEVARRVLEARSRLGATQIALEERNTWLADLVRLEQRVAGLSPEDWGRASAQYPMNDVHAAALAIIGRLELRNGAPVLRAWPANPWDPLDLTSAQPAAGPAAIDVALMDGEVRSTALNLRNASAEPILATVDLAEVTALEPGWIEARAVAWSGDADGVPVALALLPPTPTSSVAVVTVPAGVTQQILLTFSPARLAVGQYQRVLRISTPGSADIRVTVNARILPGQFPAKARLHLGGWDYLNDSATVASPATRGEVAAVLSAFGVDLPWATASAMPFGTLDASGVLVGPPNTAVFDSWVALWPKATRFRVYLSARDDLAGVRRGTNAFGSAVRSWATYWAGHVASRGIRPSDIDILFVDEPHGAAEMVERQVAWARALRDSGSGFRVWLDPFYATPGQTPADLVTTADTLCLERRLLEESGETFRDFATHLLEEGKTVELYGTAGPSSRLDPYSYYRLQSWRAFDVGATAVSFWAFTDTGGGSSWREYLAPRTVYSPLFLDATSVLPGKHLGAIREGVEDYEYLAMLRDAIARETTRRPPDDPAMKRARAVLLGAAPRVLAGRSERHSWTAGRDRTVADAVRLEVAQELQRLSGGR